MDSESLPRHQRNVGRLRLGQRIVASYFHLANAAGWTLMSSPYALGEVMRNLGKLPAAATAEWVRLRQQLKIVDDVVSPDLPAIFFASKDRPILLTALAWSEMP